MGNIWDALWTPVNCVAQLGVGVAGEVGEFVNCVVTNFQNIL